MRYVLRHLRFTFDLKCIYIYLKGLYILLGELFLLNNEGVEIYVQTVKQF